MTYILFYFILFIRLPLNLDYSFGSSASLDSLLLLGAFFLIEHKTHTLYKWLQTHPMSRMDFCSRQYSFYYWSGSDGGVSSSRMSIQMFVIRLKLTTIFRLCLYAKMCITDSRWTVFEPHAFGSLCKFVWKFVCAQISYSFWWTNINCCWRNSIFIAVKLVLLKSYFVEAIASGNTASKHRMIEAHYFVFHFSLVSFSSRPKFTRPKKHWTHRKPLKNITVTWVHFILFRSFLRVYFS